VVAGVLTATKVHLELRELGAKNRRLPWSVVVGRQREGA